MSSEIEPVKAWALVGSRGAFKDVFMLKTDAENQMYFLSEMTRSKFRVIPVLITPMEQDNADE
jgi:hypothetical protein